MAALADSFFRGVLQPCTHFCLHGRGVPENNDAGRRARRWRGGSRAGYGRGPGSEPSEQRSSCSGTGKRPRGRHRRAERQEHEHARAYTTLPHVADVAGAPRPAPPELLITASESLEVP